LAVTQSRKGRMAAWFEGEVKREPGRPKRRANCGKRGRGVCRCREKEGGEKMPRKVRPHGNISELCRKASKKKRKVRTGKALMMEVAGRFGDDQYL